MTKSSGVYEELAVRQNQNVLNRPATPLVREDREDQHYHYHGQTRF